MSSSTVTSAPTATNTSDKTTSTVLMGLETPRDKPPSDPIKLAHFIPNPNKPQVVPVVCIQTPPTMPLAHSAPNKTPTNNVIVTAVPTFQIANLVTKNAVKTPQLIIQKPSGTLQTVPVLTMVKQDASFNRLQLNKIKISDGLQLISNGNANTSHPPKYVLASMPKVTTNRLPVTATTNVVQSRFAFMPVNGSLGAKPKVFNVQIADGQMQTDGSASITVMRDNEARETTGGLICEEVIDLDSPKKSEPPDVCDKSYELSIVEESSSPSRNDVIEISIPDAVEKKKEALPLPKFQKQHGISILKRSFNFPERKSEKTNSLIISPVPNSITTISDASTKEVKITTSFDEETVSAPLKTERRRKSNVSYRKDYDDVQVNSWGVKKEQFENAHITFTELDDNDCSEGANEKKSTPEDMIEIKVIKDRVDYNMNDDYDVSKALKWDGGIGLLPGSNIKFQVNEFGLLEFMTEEEYKHILEKRAKTKGVKKEDSQEEVRCKSCGCFGMLSDFTNPSYCSFDCQESANKLVREKEVRLKRKKKKLMKKDSFEEYDQTLSDEDSPNNTSNENSQDRFNYPWTCSKKGFSWAKYLEHMKAKGAPVKLFKDPFPYNRNSFRPGMKLEGVDTQHPSYFCVLTVAEVMGYRLRLHFDGYPENYDFWVNSDSMDIFPAGWCEKYGHVLRPPPGYTVDDFNWNNYLKQTKSAMAPKHLFANRAGNAICPNGFRVGMKLEAVDRKNTALVCVATVIDMMDNRILVHFDSWDNIYDYWADPTSPYIHPVGWCDQYGHNLTPPNDYPDPESFTWERYLKETKSVAAPVRAFKQRPACGFKRGMRLECVDRRVPQLIRVATVDDVREHQIRISFDGWPDRYSYWVDSDSPDIHPVGWCQKTGHPIEPPLTPDDVYDFLECVTVGCKGQGHVRGPKFATHSNQKYCPYAEENIDLERILPDRLLSPDRQLEAVVPVSREPKEKPRGRVGRPPKIPRLEPTLVKTEWNDDESGSEKKLKRKYTKHAKYESSELAKKAAILADSLNSAAALAEQQVWTKHANYLAEFIKDDVDARDWSREEVVEFVSSLPSCEEHGDLFKKHDIDGESFLMLTQQDLVEQLKIKLGPAIKLYSSIVLLRKNADQVYT